VGWLIGGNNVYAAGKRRRAAPGFAAAAEFADTSVDACPDGGEVATDTLLELAHDVANIVALKDAAGDPGETALFLSPAPEDFEVYAALRELRKEVAERDGVPPYAVFNNAQLAEMVQKRIRSSEELGRISGVGPSRVEAHGSRFLERLTELQTSGPAEEESHETSGDSPR